MEGTTRKQPDSFPCIVLGQDIYLIKLIMVCPWMFGALYKLTITDHQHKCSVHWTHRSFCDTCRVRGKWTFNQRAKRFICFFRDINIKWLHVRHKMICVQKKSNFNKPSLRSISEESAHVPAGSKAVSAWSGARTSARTTYVQACP